MKFHQLYVVVQNKGILKVGNHIATFKNGEAYTVDLADVAPEETCKIKPIIKIHLYEYINCILPIGRIDKEVEKLPCPQCYSEQINLFQSRTLNRISCRNCGLAVEQQLPLNSLITIWNNILRRDM